MQTYGKYIFVGFMYLKKEAPYFHVELTAEIEYPWRVCPKTLIIKLPKKRGMVVGFWRKNLKPWQESLMEILKGREIGFAEINKET